MRNLKVLILMLTLVFSPSCVQSVHQLYTDQDLVSDDSLVGTWEDADSEETWTFVKIGKLEYKLIQVDEDGRSGEFSARLVNLEGKMFIDMVPIRPSSDNTDLFQGQLMRTHTFAWVARRGEGLEVSVMEMDWLRETVAREPAAIKHEKIRGDIVLTAQPKELQKFLVHSLTVNGAFSEPATLTPKRRRR